MKKCVYSAYNHDIENSLVMFVNRWTKVIEQKNFIVYRHTDIENVGYSKKIGGGKKKCFRIPPYATHTYL